MKPQSAPALRILRESAHALVMITGDAALTACHVASRLGITTRSTLILTPSRTTTIGGGGDSSNDEWEWQTPEGATAASLSLVPSDLARLAKTYDLAVGGDGLDALSRTRALESAVVPLLWLN